MALQPISLLQATALAKLQEEKLRDRAALSQRSFSQPRPFVNQLPNTSAKAKPSFVQRTQTEMAFRREKGLCYNCDEKWSTNHRCKGRVLLFIADEQSPITETAEPEQGDDQDNPEPPPDADCSHISLHALAGLPSLETFRIYGTIKNARLTVLVDSGSTHNFLQPRIAQFLKLPIQNTYPLQVMVGNDSMLACDQVCPETQVTIQGHPFVVSFHMLQISGADAVLGIDWLKCLGPVTTDYAECIMHFNHLGRDITLKADATLGPEPTSATQLKRLIQTGSTSALYQLHILPADQPDPSAAQHPILSVEHLLHQYDQLFQTPSRLPPPRQVVHRITLKPSTTPVTVRPYRYPHFQKNEIERQVSDLLSAGLIRSSTSPYSSPVLLVKKKDDTWRLCVNYRALNYVTVRDRFPIPTVDELLDELGHASWFLKQDLR